MCLIVYFREPKISKIYHMMIHNVSQFAVSTRIVVFVKVHDRFFPYGNVYLENVEEIAKPRLTKATWQTTVAARFFLIRIKRLLFIDSGCPVGEKKNRLPVRSFWTIFE